MRRTGVFPAGKTLMPGGFTPPVQMKKQRGPRSARQRAAGMGPTMTRPIISKIFKRKTTFRARADRWGRPARAEASRRYAAYRRFPGRENPDAGRIHSARADEKTEGPPERASAGCGDGPHHDGAHNIKNVQEKKPPFGRARNDGAVQRERKRAAAVRRTGVFPEGKTLSVSKDLPRRKASQSSCGRSRRNQMKIRHFQGHAPWK